MQDSTRGRGGGIEMSTTSELGTRQQVELGIQAGKSAVDAMQELTNDKGTKYERERRSGEGVAEYHMIT